MNKRPLSLMTRLLPGEIYWGDAITPNVLASILSAYDSMGRAPDAACTAPADALMKAAMFESLLHVAKESGFNTVGEAVQAGIDSLAQQVASPTAKPTSGAGWYCDDSLRDAIGEGLRGLYGCGRSWSAWSVGTMTEDDFYPAEDSDDCIDRIFDRVCTIINGAALAAQPAVASTQQPMIHMTVRDAMRIVLANLGSTADIERAFAANVKPLASSTSKTGELPPLPDPDHSLDCGSQPFYTDIQMLEYAKLAIESTLAPSAEEIRNQAIEQCAKTCEQQSISFGFAADSAHPDVLLVNGTISGCAAAIRSMKRIVKKGGDQ